MNSSDVSSSYGGYKCIAFGSFSNKTTFKLQSPGKKIRERLEELKSVPFGSLVGAIR
jgi:hypothetical protein